MIPNFKVIPPDQTNANPLAALEAEVNALSKNPKPVFNGSYYSFN